MKFDDKLIAVVDKVFRQKFGSNERQSRITDAGRRGISFTEHKKRYRPNSFAYRD